MGEEPREKSDYRHLTVLMRSLAALALILGFLLMLIRSDLGRPAPHPTNGYRYDNPTKHPGRIGPEARESDPPMGTDITYRSNL